MPKILKLNASVQVSPAHNAFAFRKNLRLLESNKLVSANYTADRQIDFLQDNQFVGSLMIPMRQKCTIECMGYPSVGVEIKDVYKKADGARGHYYHIELSLNSKSVEFLADRTSLYCSQFPNSKK